VKITIISLGKLKENYFKAAQQDYLRRIEKFVNIEIVECERILNLDRFDFVAVLDERGKQMSSLEFAEFIRKLEIEGKKVCFVIGGWSGLEKNIMKRADKIISLSKFTFPYQLARMILLEQIYRAFTIIRGIDYHK